MKYRAIISFDWGKPHNVAQQQQLVSALIQAGWLLAETTAFTLETDDLAVVWKGVGLVGRAASGAGTLTSLNFNIVSSDDFSKSRRYAASAYHKKALGHLMKRSFPG